MKEKGIAFTYDEYRKGAKQVAGLGRLSCYKGLDYLIKLLDQDNYYSEELEDTVVFIESHINHIEKENKKYKEAIDKAVEYIEKHLTDNGRFLMLNEWQVPDLLRILKEVE